MTASLKRAIGHWATSQVEDLHAFADELANSKHRYPQLVVTELSHDTQPMGCGVTEYVTRDVESGAVARTGKMGVNAVSYRLTVTAPSDRHRSGQEIVDGIVEMLESAALMTWLSVEPLSLTDQDADPPATFKLDSPETHRTSIHTRPKSQANLFCIELRSRWPPGAPFPSNGPVEHVIERIHVNEDSP